MIVKVENLTKSYGNFKAVDAISFCVEKGEIFAFLGPNGAGKTTTVKMLTTLLLQSSGLILIDQINTLKNQDAVRKKIGVVFQDPSLDDELTAYENMDFHARLYGVCKDIKIHRIKELLNLVGLWEKRDNLVKTYSGGMKRRLEIARGLSHRPIIFFLDEPTLGLDPQTRNSIWQYIRKLNKNEGITIFFTTHYMEEAEKFASKVAIIDKGKIIACDTVKKLMESTKSISLEIAFLKLTGHQIRDEQVNGLDQMRLKRRMWIK